MSITISNEYALELLENRLNLALEWWGDINDKDLFLDMYERYLDNGCFSELDPMDIVDNDIVNYCRVITKDDADYKKLLELYEAGEYDVSCEEFQEYRISFIESVSEDKERFLIRHF